MYKQASKRLGGIKIKTSRLIYKWRRPRISLYKPVEERLPTLTARNPITSYHGIRYTLQKGVI